MKDSTNINNTALIIYHSADMDGIFSGILLKQMFPEGQLMGYNYGEPFDLSYILGFQLIIIADVCFKIDVMLEIAQARKLLWFDHHETAFNDFFANKQNFESCGARVYFPETSDWQHSCVEVIYRYKYNIYPSNSDINEFERMCFLLGRYDLFDKSNLDLWSNEILPYQRFVSSFISCPEDYFDVQGCLPGLEQAIALGKKMVIKEKKLAQKSYNKLFYASFRGFKVLVSNSGKGVLDSYYSDHPNCADFISTVTRTGFGYIYGFYAGANKQINLGDIAREYGGGGHAFAAGFTHSEFLFQDITPT